MANTIQDQASSMVKGQESRMNTRASISELDRQKQEAEFASEAATNRQQNFQAVSQYNASGAQQETIQGNNLKMTGNIKVASGFGQMMMGGVMMAMAAIPGIGPTMLIEGLGLIAKGGVEVGMGTAEVEQGKQALARAQAKLDLAVENNVLSKQEASIASKEMNRSRIMEFKKELMEQMTEVVKPMLEKAGIKTDEMTEEQLSKMTEKLIEDASKSMANGGIMELDLAGDKKEASFTDANGREMEGTFHFIRDEENGKFFKVELAYDENGNPVKGPLGEPLLDTSKGMTEVESGDLKDYLELKFLFVDKLKLLAKELSYSSFDENGNVKLIPYDANNIEHMREFADLTLKTNSDAIKSGSVASPRKFSADEKGQYFQEWDWSKEIPLGPKVYLSELSGETDDMRSNIDNFQIALERSDRALQTLGLNAGGAVFNTLSASGDTGLSPKPAGNGSKILDISSRENQEFANFKSVTTTVGIVRAQSNILDGSNADDLPDGLA
jgi:hypothetical protein